MVCSCRQMFTCVTDLAFGDTGATEIAITHMDTLALACAENDEKHFHFLWNGEDHKMPIWNAKNISEDGYARDFVAFVEDIFKLPVTFLGTGRDRNDLLRK